MTTFELEKKKTNVFPGTTLFSKGETAGMKPTAVYLPPHHDAKATKLDVVIWLHGFLVKDQVSLFHDDPSKLREQVRDSGRDVVLIAPFLGYEYLDNNKKFTGHYDVKDLATPNWGERYLDEILGALALALANVPGAGATSPPQLQVGKLIIACHSGGGRAMRNLVGSLGKYQPQLKACWGFDCLYGATAQPDDATFWYQWLSGQDGRALEIVYGPSTLPQSVKLDLIGRGLATNDGDRAQTPRPPLKNLRVTVGHYGKLPKLKEMNEVDEPDPAFVDRFMIPQVADLPPLQHAPKPQPGDFLHHAITNVRRAFPFPEDIHYMIARNGFFKRLKN